MALQTYAPPVLAGLAGAFQTLIENGTVNHTTKNKKPSQGTTGRARSPLALIIGEGPGPLAAWEGQEGLEKG